MKAIKKEKLNYEEALLNANSLFNDDITRISDLSRLQNALSKYSNLDPEKLTLNKGDLVKSRLKELKGFK
ncbi:MAG: hypothetical protein COT14_01290 [Candidatus Diapherotrites archaeon CG08_land_8_20_14_0_20_30_16]|nr:MAG: hypothetical protein COT14_01290 [Candidatus Diapherotrites archaeon CG08_land_8_20_14_0_20_30_16]